MKSLLAAFASILCVACSGSSAEPASSPAASTGGEAQAAPANDAQLGALRARCVEGVYADCSELDRLCEGSGSALCPQNFVDPHDDSSMRMGFLKGMSDSAKACNMHGDGSRTAALVCKAGTRDVVTKVFSAACKMVTPADFRVVHFVSPEDQATADIEYPSCATRFR